METDNDEIRESESRELDAIIGMDGEDDPERCQAINKYGQCHYKAVPGGTNCPMHGGIAQTKSQKAKALRNYKLTKWQAKLEQYADNPNIKSLRDEVGILRIMMEQRLETCHDAGDLIYQSGPIGDLVLKIEKVVTSCHRLEGSMGQLLDKQAILQFASEIINVVGSEIEDEVVINRIANKILASVSRSTGEENEST